MKRPPQLLTVADAAREAGISKRRLLTLITEGRVLGVGLFGRQYMLLPGWSVIQSDSGPPLSESVPRAKRRY